MGAGRNWTEEEILYLEDKWGTASLGHIAKALERSENAILLKVQRLGLGAFLESGDYVTWNQLLLALGIQGGRNYKEVSWIRERNFPIKKKKVNKCNFMVVCLNDFWKWAENNKNFLDFSNFQENALGKEPVWVKPKRQHDIAMRKKYKKTPWTITEDEKLKKLLKDYKYTYTEISQKLMRTNGAITRRIIDLGLLERPLREPAHSKWENYQLELLDTLLDSSVSYEYMSEKIGKSAKAIRGKIFIMYGTESLDKVMAIRKERKAKVSV